MSFAKGFVTALTEPEPNAKKTPPPINLDIVIFLLSDLIPLKNKYNPNKP